MSTSDRESAPELPGFPGTQSGSAGDLLSDCRSIAPRWAAPVAATVAPVPPSSIHGTTVPAASAHVVAAMPEYGG